MKNKWNKKEINFLLENYSLIGVEKCSKILNRSNSSIRNKVHRLSLKLNNFVRSEIIKKYVKYNENNFNTELINNINSDFAYVLGYLWADGHVNKKTNEIRISCTIKDVDEFEKIFDETGIWLKYIGQHKNWKPQKTLYITNKKLHDFLVENDYLNKSKMASTKILNKIPQNLQHLFLLGYIDGDGCFYYNKKGSGHQFSITSTFEQDWSTIIFLFDRIGIKSYSIKRRIYKTNKTKSLSSYVRITNISDIIKLGNYIYFNSEYGLKRKRNKYNKIIS